MTARWPLVILGTLLLSVSLAQAQTARFHLLGLSDDGKAMAFEVYGVMDTTRHPLTVITLVDTEKNRYAAPQVVVRGDRDEPGENKVAEVRRNALQHATPVLQSLHITPGNTGISVLARPSGTTLKLTTFGLAEGLPERTLALTLRTIPLRAEWKTCTQGAKGIELTLRAQTPQGGTTTTVLQRDDKVPESRVCPVSYRLEDVTFSEHGHIIVVLSYMNAYPSLSGHTLNYMVVTGKLQ